MGLLDFTATDGVGVFLAGVATIVPIYVAFRETERFRKEMRERTYFEYTGRFQQIRTRLPADIFSDGYPVSELSKGDETRRWLRAYFDLCTEEIKLHDRGMIDNDEWQNWTEGICENLASPAAMWAWSNLHLDQYTTLKVFLQELGVDTRGKAS